MGIAFPTELLSSAFSSPASETAVSRLLARRSPPLSWVLFPLSTALLSASDWGWDWGVIDSIGGMVGRQNGWGGIGGGSSASFQRTSPLNGLQRLADDGERVGLQEESTSAHNACRSRCT